MDKASMPAETLIYVGSMLVRRLQGRPNFSLAFGQVPRRWGWIWRFDSLVPIHAEYPGTTLLCKDKRQ